MKPPISPRPNWKRPSSSSNDGSIKNIYLIDKQYIHNKILQVINQYEVEVGTEKILPPVSRFAKNNNHAAKKQTVLDKLAAFFERYFGLA